jgi:hypothetical protein
LASCQYNYNSSLYPKWHFSCNEEARTGRFFCIFHDENYVKNHYEEFEHEATKRFEEKIRESYSKNKPLECIGFHLPPYRVRIVFPYYNIYEGEFFSASLL